MTNILILGAGGQIARHVTAMLADHENIRLTLFVRNAAKLGSVPANARVVEGDALDAPRLAAALDGQDIVYANLAGDVDKAAQAIVAAMEAKGPRRLVFVTSLGIYDEVPGKFGKWNNAIIGEDLKPFRRAADVIEASGLAYTIVRPAWLTDEDEVDYELTDKGQPFRGTVVSRKSVADVILQVIAKPELHIGGNLGVNKPGTDADKPYFM